MSIRSLRSDAIFTSGSSCFQSTSSPISSRFPTPSPKYSLPSPKPLTDVAYTGAMRNCVGMKSHSESSRSHVSPGCKTKAGDPKVNDPSSSHPVLRQPRRTTGHSQSECPRTPPQIPFLFLLLPEATVLSAFVDNPASSHPPRGLESCTTFFAPSLLQFQCSQCRRQSCLPNFDCGCMLGEAHMLPVLPGLDARVMAAEGQPFL